jgi:LuxR family transcriptional regulator, glucitol operon activator
MIINNRRDAGYTIISRFEENFREVLENILSSKYDKIYENIPSGIYEKAVSRNNNLAFENQSDFFENIDFPDLKEITIYKDHFVLLIKNSLPKNEFNDAMTELYSLRCKIAHIKGYFTSIDLDKLISLTSLVSDALSLQEFKILLDKIKIDPSSIIIKIPSDFIEDFLDRNGILNNIPIPDYEYEGGFVGREDDRKKIIQYLNSEKFPVITITGSGGVGKTSLALKVIQDMTEKPDNKIFEAIIWLSAKENKLSDLGIEDIEPSLKNYDELLDTIIELFGFTNEIHSNIIEEKEKLVNSIIDLTSKMLIVIDNLETITDQRIINFILDASVKIKFLITSRKGLGQLERRHELRELKAKEAVYLFRQLSKDKQLTSLISLPEETIKNYVSKVSFYPLAIKWVVGQVARGKDINKIINSIHSNESDISKFCYEQIFSTLNPASQKIMYTLSLTDDTPTASILQYVVELEEHQFEDAIEELILVSLVIPEQYQNEKKEISTKYTLLPLTKGYTRIQLSKNINLREELKNRINQVENTITTTERAKKEYKHSLYNFGAKSDEEKVATIIAQTAFQKYQSGNYELAVEEYKRAIKVAPNFAPIYRNWAIMEAYENHLGEADSLMEKASKLDPNDPQIFLIWGNVYRKSSKHTEAHKKYAIAYSLTPDDPIILNAFGQAKCWLGYYDEAEKLLLSALHSNFDSVKHEVICRTSLAENYINWGDSLYKDRNYKEAESKYNLATRQCIDALEKNAKDAKIFNALSKANLRKGILFFRTRQERKALDALKAVCNSSSLSFKQGLYKLEAFVVLGEYYLSVQNTNEIKRILRSIEMEFKSSPILRKNNLTDRITDLTEYISPEKFKTGKIITINIDRGFVIIEESNSADTFLGHKFKFIPQIDTLSNKLTDSIVSFVPSIEIVNGEEKKQAKNIRITTANTNLPKAGR